MRISIGNKDVYDNRDKLLEAGEIHNKHIEMFDGAVTIDISYPTLDFL